MTGSETDRSRILPRQITFDRFANAMGVGGGVWETTRSQCRGGWSATVYSERLIVDFVRFASGDSKITQTITDIEHEAGICHDWPATTIAVIASTHESILGRLATVQRGYARGKSIIFVTLVDSRLDADRLADVANALWRVVRFSDRGVKMLSTCRQALATLVVSWRGGGDFAGADSDSGAGADADLVHLTTSLARFASPGPRPRSVTLCGGHAAIAVVDRATSERIARCQRIMTSRGVDEHDLLRDRCTPFIRAIRECATSKRTHVFLVDQRAGVDFEVYEAIDFGSWTGHLVTGVPAYQLCAQALTLAHHVPSSFFGDAVLSGSDMRAEQRDRTRRCEAIAIIRKVVGQDTVVRKIKEYVWRPTGRLIGEQAASLRKRARYV
jgi:hypothetical protein